MISYSLLRYDTTKVAQYRLEAILVPNSTKPKKTRRMATDAKIVGFIKSLREKHPRLGKEKNIPHFFTHPRCPRINGCIERYNRTLKEEFVNHHLDSIYDTKLFNQKMVEYLIFYNTKRVHKSLGLKSPMNYLIEKGHLSHMCVTYTKNCQTNFWGVD